MYVLQESRTIMTKLPLCLLPHLAPTSLGINRVDLQQSRARDPRALTFLAVYPRAKRNTDLRNGVQISSKLSFFQHESSAPSMGPCKFEAAQ